MEYEVKYRKNYTDANITLSLSEGLISANTIDFKKLKLEYTGQKHTFSLVIPAYNEESRIGPFLESLTKYLPQNFEILVICDGFDRTAEIARFYGVNVKVVQFPRRLGKGRAVIEGFKIASGDVVGFVDADGAISPEDILRLSLMVNVDVPVVIGSRWVKNSHVIRSEPVLNRLASRVFHYLTFLILGIREKDTQCGLKFFHKSAIGTIVNKIRTYDWMIDVALLYHLKLIDKKVREVGITWKHQTNSKFPLLRAVPLMFFTLLGLRLVHSKRLGNKFTFISSIAEEMINF